MALAALAAPAMAQSSMDPASSGPVPYDPDRAAAIALTASLNRQPAGYVAPPVTVSPPSSPAVEMAITPVAPAPVAPAPVAQAPIMAAQPVAAFSDAGWSEQERRQTASITAQLNRQAGFNVAAGRAFGPALEFATDYQPIAAGSPFAATTTRDVWREGEGYSERLRLRQRGELRRADGSPLPLTPLDQAAFEADGYDVTYTRGWQAARGYTASGLEVTLTPHAGVGVGDRGGRAEAGATLTIGGDIDGMVPEGSEAFGDRARWYLYAAGSGTAVGYNFARNRDGDYARSGVSRDSGSFLGDASIGVALRRGHMQGSFGLVYREVEAEGLRGGEGFDRDVSEGLVAFQLSIKPE
ncbi:lipid A-modifier LpxR family protein [Brevundimonas bacteroides]|uniref:lipid A-modifier LpxR family protein n=1 Tax=Brevundimonas bacteroides TaxID=74311 RepID=UPI000A8DF90F|nr:lipid A-modifier LpxR family protein [Brevundimonas bacteroides]